ncbi:MAG: hypothetical protein ACRDHP_07120, partial [Ktedonobacterales bacterium]
THTRRQGVASRLRRLVVLGISVGALVLAIAVATGAIGAASGLGTGYTPGKLAGVSGTAPTGQKGHATCDLPGQPKCPPADAFWSAVTSASPQGILAAMQANPAYMSPAQAEGAAGAVTATFDTPVLVLPATTGNSEYQYNLPHYIVCASTNSICSVNYDVIYDAANHRLRIGSVGIAVPNDPHYNKPFPWSGVSSAEAVSLVQSARGVALASGFTPELVYFAPNPDLANPGNAAKWSGGGTDAGIPIWRVRGSDGHAYFVGIDGKVYLPSQLPIEPGAAVAQA